MFTDDAFLDEDLERERRYRERPADWSDPDEEEDGEEPIGDDEDVFEDDDWYDEDY